MRVNQRVHKIPASIILNQTSERLNTIQTSQFERERTSKQKNKNMTGKDN